MPIVVLGGLLAAWATPARADSAAGPFASGHVLVHYRGHPGEQRVNVPPSESVGDAVRTLRRKPSVGYANPDYLVHAAAGFSPNDPGGDGRGQWIQDQWNFLSPTRVPGGIGVPGSWQRLINAGRPGGRGVTVAVLDTGVAYRNKGHRFRRDPDLPRTKRFVHPRDYVDHDRVPLDRDGHGTHVTSTIVQSTDNGLGLTGIAYGVRIMPIRVLNRQESGTGSNVARGIRFARRHGADIINLSLEFKPTVKHCDQVVRVCKAIRRAINHGVTVVAAAGNQDEPRVALPAGARGVIAAGASTYRGCAADYSDYGSKLDLVAPGGGADKPATLTMDGRCRPNATGYEIRQYSLRPDAADAGNYRKFGIVGMQGTSMASAHVSGVAAMVTAAGVCGRNPDPSTIAHRLEHSTVDRGARGRDDLYGYGLLDAARAVNPKRPC
jgi:serine protease